MSKVISLRLDDDELDILDEAAKEAPDRSAAARDLIHDGWTLKVLRKYRQGQLSTGRAAKALGLTVSEFIDLLGQLGVRTPIAYEDYLESDRAMEDLWE